MEHTYNTKLRRSALFAMFERERQEWLALGMSEADIFIMHFGEDGHGGDYAIWLSERKHIRPDHKYAPGTPMSLEEIKYEGDWFFDSDAHDRLLEVEQLADIETVVLSLTKKQATLVKELLFNHKTCAEYASDNGISKAAVSQMLSLIRRKFEDSF